MKFKGLTAKQQRDFRAYCKIVPSIKIGEARPVGNQLASSLAHWFWLWDTHGICARYSNQSLCWRLIQAKAELNLTIALWLEDLLKFDLSLGAEEVLSYCRALPKWVESSLKNSFKKKTNGVFVPEYYNILIDCSKIT